MKFSRLTKEQFEELSDEFALFLASNAIDSYKWKKIKTTSVDLTDKILDLFSDTVWNKVLSKVNYLNNISSSHIFLFKCNKNSIDSIVIKSNDNQIDFKKSETHSFFLKNLNSEKIEAFRAFKKLNKKEQKKEIHKLILNGSEISDGELYEMYCKRLS